MQRRVLRLLAALPPAFEAGEVATGLVGEQRPWSPTATPDSSTSPRHLVVFQVSARADRSWKVLVRFGCVREIELGTAILSSLPASALEWLFRFRSSSD